MECTEYTYIKTDMWASHPPTSIIRGGKSFSPLRATEYELMCRRYFKPRTHKRTERADENGEEDHHSILLSHGYVSAVLRDLLPTTHIKRLDALRYGHNLVPRRVKIDSRATLLVHFT